MGELYLDNLNTLGHTAGYAYDSLNRLTSAVATGSSTYNLTFVYDRYGNMSCQTNGQTQGLCTNVSFNSANNQINTAGYGYDAAGNLTQDITSVPTMNYQYDAEGRLTTVTQGGNPFANITYNADGQAVSIVYPVYSNTKVDGVFDPAGRELGYYDGASGGWYDQDIWAAGRMIAQAFPASFSGGLTQFLHANALGSNAQITNQTGAVAYDILYYPWGQYWTHTGRQGDTHFAGFQQSGEPFGYLTPTRHYLSALGRWMTPDPENAGAEASDPQSWNAYAYALNNPTTNVDPDGLACVQASNGTWYNDNSGGQTCEEAFSPEQNNTPSATVTAQAPEVSYVTAPFINDAVIIGEQFRTAGRVVTDSAYDFYSGFVNAFLNGKPSGLGQMGIGIATVLPGGEDIKLAEEVGALREGATLLKEGTAVGKGAEILQKAGGAAQATREFEALPAVSEQVRGATRIKTLSDGSKAVLYESSSGSGTTISLQDASGHTMTKIRY